jgi:hypothetical protein
LVALKIAVKEGTADAHAKKLEDLLTTLMATDDWKKNQGELALVHPKVHVENGQVVIGWKQHIKKTPLANMSEMVAGKLTHVGQHMHYNVALASSIADVMDSKDSMIHELAKGFSVESKICLISEIRKALMKLSEGNGDEQAAQMGMFAMMAPATMFSMSGSVDFEFDSMDEVAAHPMAGPFMVGFEQLFEGAAGKSVDECLALTLDTEGKELEGDIVSIVEVLTTVDGLTDDITDHFQIEVNVPSSLIHSCVDISAPGLGKAAKLGLKFIGFR